LLVGFGSALKFQVVQTAVEVYEIRIAVDHPLIEILKYLNAVPAFPSMPSIESERENEYAY
jgi:hypothetical protein